MDKEETTEAPPLEPASHIDHLVLDTKDLFDWGQKVMGNDELTMRIAVAYFEARIAEAVANDSMERFQKERARIAEAAHHAATAQIPCTVAQHVHAVPPGMYVARTTTPSVGGGDGLQMPDLQDPQP